MAGEEEIEQPVLLLGWLVRGDVEQEALIQGARLIATFTENSLPAIWSFSALEGS